MKGFPAYFSEWILRNLSKIMPGFCYKETDTTLLKKIEAAWKPQYHVYDMDAKANDSNQHMELR